MTFDLHPLILVCQLLISFILWFYILRQFGASEFSKNHKDISDVERFFHDELKVVELRGCVGNLYEIECVMNALKYPHKLEIIVVSWRECESLNWVFDLKWFESGCKRMRKSWKAEK